MNSNTMTVIAGNWEASPSVMEPKLYQSSVYDPADWLIGWYGGSMSSSGVSVTSSNMLTNPFVWQGVTTISGDMAGMPIEILRESRERKIKDKEHPAYALLNEQANDEQTAFTFRELMQEWALTHGNGLAWIGRDEYGQPISLNPMYPGYTTPEKDEAGRVLFRYNDPFASTGPIFVPDEDAFHLIGLPGGLFGLNPAEYGQTSLGNATAQLEYQSNTFRNAARPSGVLENDTSMNGEERRNLREYWEQIHSGVYNAGKIAILSNGVKWKPMSVNAEQAQLLESRSFSREEVAAWLNIPKYKLGDMSDSSVRANLEEQNRDYLQTTLQRWMYKWEQEIRRKLFLPRQKRRRTHIVKFNTKSRLRPTTLDRMQSYKIGREGGWLTVNDIRRAEDMDEVGPQGDILLMPLNMADASTKQPLSKNEEEPPPPNSPQVNVQNQLHKFAATEMLYMQQFECKRLKEAMRASQNGKKPFSNWCDGFYDTYKKKLIDRMAPLAATDMFCDPQQLHEVSHAYVSEACSRARCARTPEELNEALLDWPKLSQMFLKAMQNGHAHAR